MTPLEQQARTRLDRWEHALREALEQTQIEEEKHRLERELAELGQAREELSSLGRSDLERLNERLARDPSDWVSGHPPRARPRP